MKTTLFFTGLLAALVLGSPLRGQDRQVPSGIFAAAATTLDPAGQPVGYVLLTSPQPETLHGRTFSVHLKPAAATAAGEFSPQGAMAPVTTVAAASALIERSIKLGQDRSELEGALRFLYRKLKHPDYLSNLHNPPRPGDPPSPGAPPQPGEPGPAEQAVMVITRATQDAELSREIGTISLASPGMALLHGRAWAGPLPAAGQMVTVEVRLREGSGDGAVVGRVELQAGVPLKLPAPGPPVQVPVAPKLAPNSTTVYVPVDTSASHLAIGLRWATPANLRRLSLLGHGFKVYRVEKTFAIQSGWDTTRPQAEVLEGLVTQMPAMVTRLSNALHLPPKVFLENNVADFSLTASGDASTTFVVDRNERCCGQPSPGPFADGAEYFYYTVACDILGQPGEVSPGGLGKACRTIRPLAPREPRVEVDDGGNTPSVRVVFQHDPNTNEKSPPTHYEILRGLGEPPPGQPMDPRIGVAANKINIGSHLELSVTENNPGRLVSCGTVIAPAPLPLPAPQPVPAPDPPVRYPLHTLTWTDPAPFLQPGETCWYAVRAVYRHNVTPPAVACAALYSDPTAAAYASRRRTDAPDPPQLCYQGHSFPFSVVKFQTGGFTNLTYPAGELRARLSCQRENTGITHVTFELRSGAGVPAKIWEQTVYFPDTKGAANTNVDADLLMPAVPLTNSVIHCTAYSQTGAASRTVTSAISFPAPSGGVRTAYPVKFFRAGAYSLANLPPPGSVLRASVVGTQIVTTNATAMTGRGHSVATVDLGLPPAMPPGYNPTRSVLVEKSTPSGWVEVGAMQLGAGGLAVIPGEISGSIRATALTVHAPSGCEGQGHEREAANGAIAPISLGLCLTENTKEYRVYRQIGDGDLRLVGQGPASLEMGTLTLTDNNLPAVSASVQYFAQLVDGNGNASAMTALLSCPLKLIAAPPVPVLHRLRPFSANELEVEWYCASPGVERFQIFAETKQGNNHLFVQTIPNGLIGQLIGQTPVVQAAAPPGSLVNAPPSNHVMQAFGANQPGAINTRSYYTRRVGTGAAMIGHGPVFNFKVPVNGASKFKIWVKSVGPAGGVSAPSNVMEINWSAPRRAFVQGEDRVPWPARGLPATLTGTATQEGSAFTPPVSVVSIPHGETSVRPTCAWPDNTGERYLRGVVVGGIVATSSKDYSIRTSPRMLAFEANDLMAGRRNPNLHLSGLTGMSGDRVLPAVLYRRQIPSDEFPQPAGDVVQVSPLITHIANVAVAPGQNPAFNYQFSSHSNVIVDPFIGVLGVHAGTEAYFSFTFCILDTQPVIEGAAYQYFLVRFDDKGEMRDVIDAGTTTINP